MKEIILFSQAPADIQYVLSLYDKYKDSYNIKIIIVNVENNYKYLRSLNLNAELEFIQSVSQKRIFSYILFIFKLRLLYKKLFSDTSDTKIYFFSNNYDYVTSFFIEKLYQQNNEVYFVDIYKQNFSEKKSTLNSIKKAIMQCLLGIKVFFNEYSYIYIINKKIKKINMSVKEDDIEKYKYKVICKSSYQKNLLLYESNSGSNKWFADYNRDLANIISKVSNEYNIYVKPHPRLGYSKFLEKYNVDIINDYIPSELLALENFDMIFGVESTSIATSNFKKKFCLVNLFEYNDLERKKYIKNYLSVLSNKQLTFIENLDDISKV